MFFNLICGWECGSDYFFLGVFIRWGKKREVKDYENIWNLN